MQIIVDEWQDELTNNLKKQKYFSFELSSSFHFKRS